MAIVVLPTPPFWLIKLMTMFNASSVFFGHAQVRNPLCGKALVNSPMTAPAAAARFFVL
jgi:hypothetical protein